MRGLRGEIRWGMSVAGPGNRAVGSRDDRTRDRDSGVHTAQLAEWARWRGT